MSGMDTPDLEVSGDTVAVVNDEVEVAEDGADAVDVECEGPAPFYRRRKFWVLAAVVTALVAVVIIGIIAALGAAKERSELRADVEGAFAAAVTSHEDALHELSESLSSARTALVSVEESAVADPSTLSDLSGEMERATQAHADAEDTTVIDIEGQSNEEVEAATSRISNETESLRAQTVTLDALVAAVDDSVAAKKEADEEARIAAEKERLEAEIAQKKSAAQPIGYEDLFRAGDTLIGQYFRFEGKIVQTLGASGTTSGYRINITADQGYSRVFWEDTVMLMVSGETPQKLLEDDIVSFTAASAGLTSYTSVLGATIELPLLTAEGSDLLVTGRDG